MRAAFLAVLAGLWLGTAQGLAAEAIERFRSDIAVAADGTLSVTETIAVRAEGRDIRRGIYRDFPTTFEDADGTVREVGFRLLGVTRNGRAEPHSLERYRTYVRFYAGDSDVFLEHGSHLYVFTYETDRQIRWIDGSPELYWNVTGNDWRFPILRAEARVTLPDGAEPVRFTAYTGRSGARGTDWAGRIDSGGGLAVETTRPLAPGEGLTIVAALPAGSVTPPGSLDETRYFLRDYRGWIVGGLGVAALLAYYLAAWNAVGRDPQAGTVIPLFRPPEGVSPALASYIRNWGFSDGGWRAFTAASLSLAVRGLLIFDDSDGHLVLRRTDAAPEGGEMALPPGERAVLRFVEEEGGRADISKANGEDVMEAGRRFRSSIEAENRDRFFQTNLVYFFIGLALTAATVAGLVVTRGLYADDLALLAPAAFVAFFIGFGVLPLLRRVTSASPGQLFKLALTVFVMGSVIVNVVAGFAVAASDGGGGFAEAIAGLVGARPLPFVLLVTFTLLNGLFFYLLRAPTALGRPVMDQLDGFRMYLTTAETPRLNMAGAPEITTERFEALLPYAVALDAEKPWADAFAAALARARPDDPDPTGSYRPAWHGGRGWSGGNFGRAVSSGMAGAAGAFSAATPKSSSSGFSGGGGSGGGGGGGGGGGW